MTGGGAMAVGGSRAGETAAHGGQLVGGTQLALGSLRERTTSERVAASVYVHIPPKERGEHPGKEHAHGSVVVVVAGGGTPWEEAGAQVRRSESFNVLCRNL